MTDRQQQVAIAFGDIKQAYLYFDHVIPVYIPDGFSGQIAPPKLINNPPSRTKGKKGRVTVKYGETGEYHPGKMNPSIYSRIGGKLDSRISSKVLDYCSSEYEDLVAPYLLFPISQLAKDLRRAGYFPLPVIGEHTLPKHESTGFESISVISSNVAQIATATAEWEQIYEFKKDKVSRAFLRNYRLFWGKNYKGYDRNFICDDLEKKLDAFFFACKKHGLTTTHEVIGNIIHSKSMLAAATLAFASAMAGEPLLLSSALASGIGLELGKISLTISKSRL